MGGYKNLLEAIIKRQFGIIGRDGVFSIMEEMNLKLDSAGNIMTFSEEEGKELLGELMEKFLERHGLISIVGCRIQVRKLANQMELELPEIFE